MKKLLFILLLLPALAWGQADPTPSGVNSKPVTSYQKGDTTYMLQNSKWFWVVNRAYSDGHYASLLNPNTYAGAQLYNALVTFGANVRYTATPDYFIGSHLTIDGSGNVKQDSTTYWGKHQVDSAISAHPINATNGLQTISPDSIGLGGTLTQDVSIDGLGHNFSVSAETPNETSTLFVTPTITGFSKSSGNNLYDFGVDAGTDSGLPGAIMAYNFNNGVDIPVTSSININKHSMNVYDGVHNTGLIDSVHHTITSGLQLAEIQDIGSVAIDTSTINKIRYLFIIGGQSNVLAKGDTSLSPKLTPDIAIQYYNGYIRTANDPIGPLADTLFKGSPWPAFFIRLHQLTGKAYLSIQNGVGNTAQSSLAGATNGNWDVSGTLLNTLFLRTDSAISYATANGLTPILTGMLWNQGEFDANAIQTGTMTGGDYYTAASTMCNRVHAKYGSNFPIYVIRLIAPNSGTSFGYDTVRNRQEQLAAAGYWQIIDRESDDFPALGLMNPNSTYTKLHPSQIGYNRQGSNSAENIAGGYGNLNYKRPPGLANKPSFVIPKGVRLTTYVPGAQENDGTNLYESATTTRQRKALIPQDGILPGAILFGGSDRNMTTDSANYRATNGGFKYGPDAFFSVQRTGAFVGVGANSGLVLEKYNTSPSVNLNFLAARGTQGAGSAILSGDNILTINPYGYNGTTFINSAAIKWRAIEDFSGTGNGTSVDYFVTPTGATSSVRPMYLSQNRGLYLTTNASGDNITDITKLYVKSETADAATVLVDNTGTIPNQIWRNFTNPTNTLTLKQTGSASTDLNSALPFNINVTSGSKVNFGSGATLLPNVALASVFQKTPGTAGTDSILVSTSGKMGRIPANAYLLQGDTTAFANTLVHINGTEIVKGTKNFQKYGLVTTPVDAVIVSNGTAATSGVTSQVSPKLTLSGAGWDAGSTSSKTSSFSLYTLPSLSASNTLIFQSINGTTTTTPAQLTSTGNFYTGNGGGTTGSVGTGSITLTQTGITSTTLGEFLTNPTAPLNSGQHYFTPAIKWGGWAWNTTSSTAESQSFYIDNEPQNGATTSGLLVFKSQLSTGALNTAATLSSTGNFSPSGTIILKGYTVATLPTPVVGMTAYVTDALTPASLAVVVGGGSSVVPVFYNGTNWVVQ